MMHDQPHPCSHPDPIHKLQEWPCLDAEPDCGHREGSPRLLPPQANPNAQSSHYSIWELQSATPGHSGPQFPQPHRVGRGSQHVSAPSPDNHAPACKRTTYSCDYCSSGENQCSAWQDGLLQQFDTCCDSGHRYEPLVLQAGSQPLFPSTSSLFNLGTNTTRYLVIGGDVASQPCIASAHACREHC